MPARRFPLLCSLVATAALTATAATAQAAAELPQPVWETPQAVGTLDNAPVNVRATPQGRLIAGWELGQSFMVAVRDPGGDWRPQEPVLTGDDVSNITAVASSDGDFLIAGQVSNGGVTRVTVAMLLADSQQWESDQLGDVNGSWGPSLAADGAGRVFAAWTENDGSTSRAAVAVRQRGASGFDTPAYASPGTDNAGGARVYAAGDGEQIAAWTDTSGGSGHHVMRARSRSTTDAAWGDVTTISGEAAGFFPTAGRIRDDGTAVLLWLEQMGGDVGARRVVRSADGSWNPPDLIYQSGAAPGLTLTARGDFVQTGLAGTGADLVGYASVLRAGETGWSAQVAPLGTGIFSGMLEPAARPDGTVYAALPFGPSIMSVTAGVAAWDPDSGEWSMAKSFDGEPVYAMAGLGFSGDDEGNVVMAWAQSDGTVMVSLGDGAGPALSDLSVPAAATAGERVPVSVSADDRWSDVASVRWEFGDGSAATGEQAGHTYAAGGTYTVTVRATDGRGQPTTTTRTITVSDPPAPPSDNDSGDDDNRPVVIPPVIEARLSGRTITLNAKLTLKKGKRCSGTVKATTAFGGRSYKATLRLATKNGACRATGTIKLKKTPSLRTKLRVTISGKQAKSRTLTTRRG